MQKKKERKAPTNMAKTNHYFYRIYKGRDEGSSTPCQDWFIDEATDPARAIAIYNRAAAQQCAASVNAASDRKNTRFYVYMTRIDTQTPLMGFNPITKEPEEKGACATTVFVHNFTQNPKNHNYMEDIENGTHISYSTIIEGGRYQHYTPIKVPTEWM